MDCRGNAPRWSWPRWVCAVLAGIVPVATTAGEGRKLSLLPGSRHAAVQDDVDEIYYRPLTVVRPGASSSAVRKAAVEELPLATLPPDARQKAQQIIQGLGLYRQLPTLSFETDPQVHHFLVKNPVTSVSSWRAMEISRLMMKQTGPATYFADAGDGSVGAVEVWKCTAEDTLIYCDGAFKSPLLTKPIIARSLMRLKARFYTDDNGRPRVEHTGDVFVEFPSQTVETVAKVISPVSYSIADRNFKQLSLFVHLMSQAMTRHPAWLRTIVARMDVSDAEKIALLQVCEATYAAAERRSMGLPPAVPVDEILAPLRRSINEPAGIATPPPRTAARAPMAAN